MYLTRTAHDTGVFKIVEMTTALVSFIALFAEMSVDDVEIQLKAGKPVYTDNFVYRLHN